jgi:hypothetical protein
MYKYLLILALLITTAHAAKNTDGQDVVVLTPKECVLVDEAVQAHVQGQKLPKLTKNAKRMVDYIIENNKKETLEALVPPGLLTEMCYASRGVTDLPVQKDM